MKHLKRIALPLLAAVFCLAAALSPALAKDKAGAAKAETATLPDPLTKESIRELVSRLDDAEVRALLIKQLDHAAAPAAVKKADDMAAFGIRKSLGPEIDKIGPSIALLPSAVEDSSTSRISSVT